MLRSADDYGRMQIALGGINENVHVNVKEKIGSNHDCHYDVFHSFRFCNGLAYFLSFLAYLWGTTQLMKKMKNFYMKLTNYYWFKKIRVKLTSEEKKDMDIHIIQS